MIFKSTINRMNRLAEIAFVLRKTKQTGRNFHLTAIYDKNKLVSLGYNDYNKPYPEKRFNLKYIPYKCTNGQYIPCRHSEVEAALLSNKLDFSDYMWMNVRINNSGKLDFSKPCPNCLRLIKEQLGYRNIYYFNQQLQVEEIL